MSEHLIALAGNPNVGKSTLFNALTGLRQHTGNWPGKTVLCARGRCSFGGQDYALLDLPGTYSLLAHSAEEEVARDALCFGEAEAAVVVCDATALERNLNLVLQVLECQPRTVVCVNLMDEAARKGISLDLPLLSRLLGVPVVGTAAGTGQGLTGLMEAVSQVVSAEAPPVPRRVPYPPPVETAAAELLPLVGARWLALRLLTGDEGLLSRLDSPALRSALAENPLTPDDLLSPLVEEAQTLARRVTISQPSDYALRDRRLDRLLTSRRTGIPLMLLLLAGVLWLTMAGANVPSQLLAGVLFSFQDRLTALFSLLHAPDWLHGMLVLGVWRVLAWVVSVMLPPMAIFFPLFTLLEDFGYLPRVAFVLDHAFQKAHACGKQALTMCMGFGCNAAGVVGCRIIDSPRERLIAILTNSLVPCNGRFPILIALIGLFFAGTGPWRSLRSALFLTGAVVLGVGLTFLVSRLLSRTVLKGLPSAFTLELPPYRRPRAGQVLLRSVLDRTLFVLGRAMAVAAPAGLIIWLAANCTLGGVSFLARITAFLDPLGRLLGLDGVILTAFLLGLPANEIVIPLMLMAYLSTGTLSDYGSLASLGELLRSNGWNGLTALCTLLFTLFHWPCSTTLLTIHREAGSGKWTLLALLIPTLLGMLLCFLTATAGHLLGF